MIRKLILVIALTFSGCGTVISAAEDMSRCGGPKPGYFYDGVRYDLRQINKFGEWLWILDLPFSLALDTPLLVLLNLPLGG
jgi:uncharacterized protein YceK